MRKKVLFFLMGMGVLLTGCGNPVSTPLRSRVACAQERMYLLEEVVFNINVPLEQKQKLELPDKCGGKTYKLPGWFADELARMEKNKVVYVPGEKKTFSEADLWRQAFANVWTYLERAGRSLDPNQPMIPPSQLARENVGNRINLVATLDRLNKDLLRGDQLVVMKDSMEGRARSMLATLELINGEFFSTIESFSGPMSTRDKKYRQSVKSVVVLSNHLFRQFFDAALPMKTPDAKSFRITRADRMISLIMIILGSIFAGMFVYLLINIYHDQIIRSYEDYHAKSEVWAEDFNRQFITMDVKYIVLAAICFFGFLGAFMGWNMGGFTGLFVFLMSLAIGLYVGVRIPSSVLESMKRSRGARINKQLMDSLILLSNSLRSGMDIVQGFELVSRDMLPPIADEFGLVVKNYQLGTPFEQALDGLTKRVDSRMLDYVVKAIIIQRQVGGNLTVIFARLVENIREESKLEEKLQAMTAQQKIQSIVVSVMPFIMLGMMFLFNPSQMISFYTSFVGICIFVFCCVWIGIGMAILRKIGNVRV